ncbi:hypothetical protein ACWF9X_02495 [Streptomyces globisporus]
MRRAVGSRLAFVVETSLSAVVTAEQRGRTFALAGAVVGLRTTVLDARHRLSVRVGPVRSFGDPRGTFVLAGAVVLAALLAWSLPLLVPVLPGSLAFAATWSTRVGRAAPRRAAESPADGAAGRRIGGPPPCRFAPPVRFQAAGGPASAASD